LIGEQGEQQEVGGKDEKERCQGGHEIEAAWHVATSEGIECEYQHHCQDGKRPGNQRREPVVARLVRKGGWEAIEQVIKPGWGHEARRQVLVKAVP
jgi:hypothetical protein